MPDRIFYEIHLNILDILSVSLGPIHLNLIHVRSFPPISNKSFIGMFVQREPERQYYPAPSARRCQAGCENKDMRAFECCAQAIKSLLFIMKDLKRVLECDNVPLKDIRPDATDLLYLVHYLLRWPLRKAYDYIHSWQPESNDDSDPNTADAETTPLEERDARDIYRDDWEDLLHLTCQIDTLLTQPGAANVRAKLRSFQNQPNSNVEGTPALGAVELLLRVVAEASQSTLICKY